MMLFLLKIAAENRDFRRALRRKLAEEDEISSGKKGLPKGFKKYWNKIWDGGKKIVKNPNREGRKKDVTANTAMKDKKFYRTVMRDFKEWSKKNEEKRKNTGPQQVKTKEKNLLKEFEKLKKNPSAKGAVAVSKAWKDLNETSEHTEGLSDKERKRVQKQLDRVWKEVGDVAPYFEKDFTQGKTQKYNK